MQCLKMKITIVGLVKPISMQNIIQILYYFRLFVRDEYNTQVLF